MPIFQLVLGFIAIPVAVGILRAISKVMGICLIVQEREAYVYELFGKVIGVFSEPGLNFPIFKIGPIRSVLLLIWGKRHRVSTSLKQNYLRNQMVNSEEGTPMGVGVWYEMRVTDPVSYLYNNVNPDGSLEANVASSTISTLSNLEMEKMLEDRHSLSHAVRAAVSPQSLKWGYELGSVYIRKVAFTDRNMVENITEKVVKRLIQVTSAMRQDGENRVGLIRSETAHKVSQKMAEAGAMRPQIVGDALNEIAKQDPEILKSVIKVMEIDKLVESGAEVEVVPESTTFLVS